MSFLSVSLSDYKSLDIYSLVYIGKRKTIEGEFSENQGIYEDFI